MSFEEMLLRILSISALRVEFREVWPDRFSCAISGHGMTYAGMAETLLGALTLAVSLRDRDILKTV